MAAEWWKSDVEAVIDEAIKSGLAPNVSDSHLINGYPGPVPNCPNGILVLSSLHFGFVLKIRYLLAQGDPF